MFFSKQKYPMLSNPYTRFVLEESEKMRQQKTTLMQQLYDMESFKTAANTNIHIRPKADHFKTFMQRHADRIVKTLSELRDKKIHGLRAFRQFQLMRQITRPVRQPDLFNTGLVIASCWLVEGGMGAGLFLADGMMSLIPAIATGFAVAGVNILMSCGIGFFTIRYFTHLRRYIRHAAKIGFVIGTLMLILLHFGAARSRAVGGHSDIFDFSQVGFFSTFGNYFSLSLFMLGLFGSVIAIYKGVHGFSDPETGYAQIHKDTHEIIHNDAETAYAAATDRLDELLTIALKDVTDSYKKGNDAREQYIKTWHKSRQNIAAHNQAMNGTIAHIKAIMEEAAYDKTFFEQAPVTVNQDIFQDLEDFKIDLLNDQPDVHLDTTTLAAVQAELQEIHTQYSAIIEAAMQDFLSPIEEFSLDDHNFNLLGASS
jgi:hypothetical protein